MTPTLHYVKGYETCFVSIACDPLYIPPLIVCWRSFVPEHYTAYIIYAGAGNTDGDTASLAQSGQTPGKPRELAAISGNTCMYVVWV